MAAHHIKHALSCPAAGNGELIRCTCDAPGAKAARTGVTCINCGTRGDVGKAIEVEYAGRVVCIDGVACEGRRRARADAAARRVDAFDAAARARMAERDREIRADRLARDVVAGERIIAGATMSGAQPNRITVTGPSTDHEREGRAISLGDQLARLLGRPLHVEFGLTMAVVRQRCAACREDIRASVSRGDHETAEAADLAAFAAIGTAARKAYLQHRCAPVDTALLGFTYAEIEALHVELERDSLAMAERADAIAKLLDAQSRSAT